LCSMFVLHAATGETAELSGSIEAVGPARRRSYELAFRSPGWRRGTT
jgi:hypothetical protein